ncbi:MAG: universal stress protein [Prosthecobacter sp.]
MKTLNTILVAVDFSTGSRAALEQAARIAHLQGAALHVLHVIDSAAVTARAESRESRYENQARTAAEGASVALDRWLETIPLPACRQVHIVTGTPLEEILAQALKLEADLLVAGIAGSGDAPAGIGSVSGKLARQSASRVLLVRASHPQAFKKVVACIDFSETSREVAAAAHRIALKDGAGVDFLHVWQDPWMAVSYGVPFGEVGAPAIVATSEQREEFLQNLNRELHAFVSEASQGIESAEVLHEAANYGKGIAAYALESGADLIIIGNRGRTNLLYVLLGSTAEFLLTQLPCSLLVVKPAAE